jgi:hypothetical protein
MVTRLQGAYMTKGPIDFMGIAAEIRKTIPAADP